MHSQFMGVCLGVDVVISGFKVVQVFPHHSTARSHSSDHDKDKLLQV